MALNKEIWIGTLVEDFLPNNSFISHSTDHSGYVDNKTVHVPNGGAAPKVTKNRKNFPAAITERDDTDLTYNLDKYDTPPILVQNLDVVELSYDKRTSILAQSKRALQDFVIMDILKNWAAKAGHTVATLGSSEAAHVHTTATGSRKAMDAATVLAVKKQMDAEDVPADGRCMLLDAIMYNQLLNSLTSAENVNFLAGADPVRGVLGTYLGFNFFMRSSVLKTTSGGALKTGNDAATDCAAGLAWHPGSVSRALGSVEAFESENDPTYYGSIISFAMRAGGTCIRSDKKGVILINQATV